MAVDGANSNSVYKFQLTREDWAAFVRECAGAPDHLFPILAFALFLCGAAWSLLADWEFTTLGQLLVCCAIALAALIFGKVYQRFRNWRKIKAWTQPTNPTRVEDCSSHLEVRQNGQTIIYEWERFSQIMLGKHHVFLAVSPADAIIMPLRSFKSRQLMEAFHSRAEIRSQGEEDDTDSDWDLAQNHPATPLNVRVNYRHEDIVQLSTDAAPGKMISLSRAVVWLAILGGLLSGGGALLWSSWLKQPFDFELWSAFTWPGAVLLTWLGVRRIEAKSQAKWPDDDPRLKLRDFNIGPEGIFIKNTDFESRVGWGSVTKIEALKHYITFTTRWADIFVVPKRCFETELSTQAFVTAARAWKIQSERNTDVESAS